MMWGFPILRMMGLMPQAAPPSAPPVAAVPVTPTVANGISDTVELTPEEGQALQDLKTPVLEGTATTASGLECEIWHHPIDDRYSVICPKGNELFNKNKEFRSYEDAEWYITDVIGGS